MTSTLVTDAGGSRREAPGAPGFWQGVRSFFGGVQFLAARRDCWLVASVPCFVVAIVALPLGGWAIGRVGPWLADWLLPNASNWYALGAHALVRWLASALGVFMAFWVALLAAPVLSAPALEHLVRVKEAALGVPPRPSRGFFYELWCGLEAQLGGLLLALPLWLLYWVVAALIPGAAIVLLPLQVLPLSLGIAWNLLDYPLTLRGMRMRERFALLRARPAPILGFGLCFAAATWVPGAAFLLLPAGVVGATRLSWRLLPEATPEG